MRTKHASGGRILSRGWIWVSFILLIGIGALIGGRIVNMRGERAVAAVGKLSVTEVISLLHGCPDFNSLYGDNRSQARLRAELSRLCDTDTATIREAERLILVSGPHLTDPGMDEKLFVINRFLFVLPPGKLDVPLPYGAPPDPTNTRWPVGVDRRGDPEVQAPVPGFQGPAWPVLAEFDGIAARFERRYR